MRTVRRLAAAALAVAAGLVLVLAHSAPAQAAAPAFLGGTGACIGGSGALVAVDFRAFAAGSIVRGCDPTPTDGRDLLATAGFATSGTARDGDAFICRIGHSQYTGVQYPTPAQETCAVTPPASRYWSYWVADPDSTTWRYSSLGANANPVSNGTAEAWVYGSTTLDGTTGQPSFTPAEVRTGAAAPTAPGAFASVAPYRLTDTRQPGNGGPVAAQSARTIPVTGRGGVPATGVSAVVVNITITEPTAAGNLIAYAAAAPRPLASNLNFVPGQTVPNLAVVPVNANGEIDLYNSSPGPTHVIADVAGYYLAGTPTGPGAFGSVAPYRLTDTRQTGNGGPVPAQTARTIPVTGRGGVPATGVSAVVVNITITEPTAAGNLIAYAAAAPRPLASNLNFVPGQTVPNLAVVPVNANGEIALYNSSPGPTHVIADVAGYYLR